MQEIDKEKPTVDTGDVKIDLLMPVLYKKWFLLPFEETLEKHSISFCKLKKHEISSIGRLPVIDQGAEFISGYTNDLSKAYKGKIPLIIFGDHTQNIKYVDIEFAVGADGTKILHPKAIYGIRFYYHYLCSLNFLSAGYSRHYKYLKQIFVPLPPFNEQKRIAAKLDQIMSKIDGVKERLERIPQIIKNFRQSVLTAAVTGKLTEKWRNEHPEVESAEELLKRIRKEREERYKKKCDIAKKNRERKPKKIHDFYDAAVELPFNTPETWKNTRLGNIIYDFCYGTSEKSDYDKKGTPIVRIPNVLKKYLDLSDVKYLDSIEKNENNKMKENDVLIIRSNGSKALVGKNCIVPKLAKEFAFASYLIRIRPSIIDANFVYTILNSPIIKGQFFSQAKSSAGINNINTEELASVLFALPPIREQREIVRQVDKSFAIADKLEEHYQKAKLKVAKFPQSVLAKAFRGELVPQDPNDEPAEKLLERIQEEKAK